MKKWIALLLSLAMVMSVMSFASAQEPLTASVAGFGGDVTVTVEVDGEGKIVSIAADGSTQTPDVGGNAANTLNEGALAALAGTELAELDAAGIEGITGATVTSDAIKTALEMIKAEATGAEATPVQDGTYTVTVPAYSVTEQMTLNITFEGGKLTGIETVTAGNTPVIFATVEEYLYPRLIENQSLETDAITGATVASGAVKQAVEKAIEMAGGNAADWHAPVAKSDAVVELNDYDVIVVGLGGAGMTAYLSAAENGATVFGIEKAAKIGGNSTNTAGPMAINPPSRVEANGGQIVPPEDLLADWAEYTTIDGQQDAKLDVVEMFINNSGETLDWMEKYSFQFGEKMQAFFHPAGWQVWTSYAGKDGKTKDDAYIEAMDAAKAMNEKNDYMLELTAEELLMEDGKVAGVKAVAWDGTTYLVHGKSVILATGGFVGDEELSNEYIHGVWKTEAMTQCDGAGIKMAQKAVNANLYNLDVVPVSHIAQVYNIVRNDDLTADQKAVLTSLVLDKAYPVVGEDGVKVNDKIGMFFAFDVWAAGPTYYVIYSENEMNGFKENGLVAANTPMFLAQGGAVEAGVPVADLDQILSVGEAYGDVFKADSLAALAEQLGLEKLTENVEDQGGAYYAIKGASYVYSTCGGVEVDTNLNVVDVDGNPVPGLYAVGNDSLGVLLASEKAYVTYGGAAAGWALTSGRLAGAYATAYAKGE
ncbi:MAG: FAD-binding protein [Oscillospiraceae bacterium]|nr:FAD-binding protein [Clostridia bacterium]MBR0392972.1 FAD-binding protein [Oscillospiraceae bacterium]